MKLHFEPDLDYQKAAIKSVVDLFRGQEINRTEFTVTRRPSPSGPVKPASLSVPFSTNRGSWGLSKANLASATA